MRVPVAFGVIMLLPLAGMAQEPASSGEDVFKKCLPCHTIGTDAAHKIGPHLNGVVGRPLAGLDDYVYSQTLQRAGEAGEVWSEERLGLYLKNPRHAYPGTSMAFAGMRQRADILAVIDYMASFDEDGEATP